MTSWLCTYRAQPTASAGMWKASWRLSPLLSTTYLQSQGVSMSVSLTDLHTIYMVLYACLASVVQHSMSRGVSRQG